MGEAARTQQTAGDFSGMVSNADPHDVRNETSVRQVNVTSGRKGELVIRRGLKEVSFDDEGV